MSHSLGTVAISPDGAAMSTTSSFAATCRSPLAIPSHTFMRPTPAPTPAGGLPDAGRSDRSLDCTVLGKYVFEGIHPTDSEVTIDVGLLTTQTAWSRFRPFSAIRRTGCR